VKKGNSRIQSRKANPRFGKDAVRSGHFESIQCGFSLGNLRMIYGRGLSQIAVNSTYGSTPPDRSTRKSDDLWGWSRVSSLMETGAEEEERGATCSCKRVLWLSEAVIKANFSFEAVIKANFSFNNYGRYYHLILYAWYLSAATRNWSAVSGGIFTF
jgi:hypothetical protein